jgi:hypothetical protein
MAVMGVLVLAAAASPRAIGEIGLGSGSRGTALSFEAGPDSSSGCTSYPCASVEVSGGTEAQVSMSFGIESAETLQPATYYTDLLLLTNPTNEAVTISSVIVSGATEAEQGDIGAVLVFYCASQTNAPQGNCQGSFTMTGIQGGGVFSGTDTLAPGATRYIEFEGFAGQGAHVGDQISFTIEVESD